MTDTQSPSTDLELAKANVLAIPIDDEWGDVDDGVDGIEHIGISMPLLRGDMRPGGGFIDELTGDKRTELDVVILTVAPTRAYWSAAFGEGDKAPDCRSVDMARPDPGSPKRQAETCAACPHSQWNGDEAPACGERINALLYDPATQQLAQLGFSGTAIKHVRRYLSSFKARLPKRPPMSVVTHISLEEVEDKGMRWLEPRFSRGAEVDRASAQPLIEVREAARATWQQRLAENLATGADVAPVGATSAGAAGYDPFPDEDLTRPFEQPADQSWEDVDGDEDVAVGEVVGEPAPQADPNELGAVLLLLGEKARLDAAGVAAVCGVVNPAAGGGDVTKLSSIEAEAIQEVLRRIAAGELRLEVLEGREPQVVASTGPVIIDVDDELGTFVIEVPPAPPAPSVSRADQWKELIKQAGITQTALLRRARKIAEELEVDVPNALDEISGDVADRCVDWLRQVAA